jgi:hypothetical protein
VDGPRRHPDHDAVSPLRAARGGRSAGRRCASLAARLSGRFRSEPTRQAPLRVGRTALLVSGSRAQHDLARGKLIEHGRETEARFSRAGALMLAWELPPRETVSTEPGDVHRHGEFVIPFDVDASGCEWQSARWGPALIIAALIARSPTARRSMFGLVTGVGLPLLVVAYVQRDGPGTTCWHTATTAGCDQDLNPIPWLVPPGCYERRLRRGGGDVTGRYSAGLVRSSAACAAARPLAVNRQSRSL